MTDSQVQIKIPEGMVTDLVRAEMVRNLGNTEALMDAVVKAAFQHKANSYDRHSLFEKQCKETMLKEAAALFKEWIAENREELRKRLLAQLKANRSKVLNAVVGDMIGNLSKWHVHVSMNWKEED